MSIRLNKLLASRGLGSRRRCDVLIAEGLVRINGKVVTEAGTTVEEGRDRIEVDGTPIPGRQRLVYYALNKPVGVITTLNDPEGRRSIRELLPRGARVYPVGRLDADTSGLLLLTNDGELAHKLMHPRYGVTKTYRVRLDREPSKAQLSRLERGVEFEPGVVSAPAKARRIDPGFDAIMIELQIHEGRYRQVRRMCEAVGMNVTGLHRVGYGPLRLGPMTAGIFRELSEQEVRRLQAAAARPTRGGRPRAGGAPRASRPEASGAFRVPPAARSGSARPGTGAPPPDEDDDVEETWVPGGGFASEFDDDETPAWPMRPDGRLGDADFVRGKPRPASRLAPVGRAARPANAGGAPRSRARDERAPRPGARAPQAAPRSGVRGAPAPRSGGARGERFPRADARLGRTPRATGARNERMPVPDARGERVPRGMEKEARPKRRGRGPRPGPRTERGARFGLLSARGPGATLRNYRGSRAGGRSGAAPREAARMERAPRGSAGRARPGGERPSAGRPGSRVGGTTRQTFGRESARPAAEPRVRAGRGQARRPDAPAGRPGRDTAPRGRAERGNAPGRRPSPVDSRAGSGRRDRGFSPASGRSAGSGAQSGGRGGRPAGRPGAAPRRGAGRSK